MEEWIREAELSHAALVKRFLGVMMGLVYCLGNQVLVTFSRQRSHLKESCLRQRGYPGLCSRSGVPLHVSKHILHLC